jgi:hypothetical protein
MKTTYDVISEHVDEPTPRWFNGIESRRQAVKLARYEKKTMGPNCKSVEVYKHKASKMILGL